MTFNTDWVRVETYTRFLEDVALTIDHTWHQPAADCGHESAGSCWEVTVAPPLGQGGIVTAHAATMSEAINLAEGLAISATVPDEVLDRIVAQVYELPRSAS